MKISSLLSICLSICVVLAVLAQAAPARSEGWSLSKLNPFAEKEPPSRVHKTAPEPSMLEKFNTGTKKFFGDARDALTFKKPAPKTTTIANPYAPWQHHKKPEKQSWLSSMFRPKEPEPIQSLDEWMSLPRLDP